MRMSAVQWHHPGDAVELGVQPYRHGAEVRHGLHTPTGLQRVTPGDWIVVGPSGTVAQVYGPREFNHKFTIIEESSS
jgi:hypothetical protein